jgi:nucleotide-binding universal stress UspA family protein
VPIDGAELLLIRPWDTPAALRPATVLGRRVLVALDGSDLAGAALPVARLLAERAGGEVGLMRVVPPRHDAAAYAGRARAATPVEERRRAEAYLEDMAGGLRERGVLASTTVRVAEDVAQAIADAASTDGADVIAMSTHGARTGAARSDGSSAAASRTASATSRACRCCSCIPRGGLPRRRGSRRVLWARPVTDGKETGRQRVTGR